MITTATARKLTAAELEYAARDIREAIEAQEPTARQYGMAAVPKLGTYYDELHAVAAELKRRGLRS